MFSLHFDPVTTEMVIGKRKKQPGTGTVSTATLSALIVPMPLELLVNNLNVVDSIEITDTGAFTIFPNSAVEVT
jgi:hypothetical protein